MTSLCYNLPMENNVNFSLIVPVYNTKKEFLQECIESVLKQDYDNYEVIVVDDGSNQETKSFLTSFNNEKLQIITQENQGVIKARINGVKQSKGEYIVFVDSDDFIMPNMLTLMNDIIQKYKAEVIMYESIRFTNDINHIIKPTHWFKDGPVSKTEALDQLLRLHINAFSDKCCKKEILSSLINNIDTTIVNGEDLQQSTYLLLTANSIYYTDKPISYYRINEEYREYYDVTRLHDINYLVPTYKMVFKDNNIYNDMLPTYKQAAVNSVLYTAFNLIWLNKSKNETHDLLDELNQQEITKILSSIPDSISTFSQFVFNLLINKQYSLLSLVAKIYKLIT